MTQQTNAQRLADELQRYSVTGSARWLAAEELRRLDAVEKIADDLQDLCDKQALKLAATEAERDQLRAHNDELRSELSILTLAHDQLRAQVERLQGGEPVPVEIWRNDRKVTIYPSENVLCVWGKKATEMSEAPFTLASVQSAIDWLYTAQPAAPALVPLTFEQAHNLFLSFMAEPNWTAMDWYFKGLRDSEAHHGIGQPVGGAG